MDSQHDDDDTMSQHPKPNHFNVDDSSDDADSEFHEDIMHTLNPKATVHAGIQLNRHLEILVAINSIVTQFKDNQSESNASCETFQRQITFAYDYFISTILPCIIKGLTLLKQQTQPHVFEKVLLNERKAGGCTISIQQPYLDIR